MTRCNQPESVSLANNDYPTKVVSSQMKRGEIPPRGGGGMKGDVKVFFAFSDLRIFWVGNFLVDLLWAERFWQDIF